MALSESSVIDRGHFSERSQRELPVEAVLAGEAYQLLGLLGINLASRGYSLNLNTAKIEELTGLLKAVREAQNPSNGTGNPVPLSSTSWNKIVDEYQLVSSGYDKAADSYTELSKNIAIIEAKLDELTTISQDLSIAIESDRAKKEQCVSLIAATEKSSHDTNMTIASKT